MKLFGLNRGFAGLRAASGHGIKTTPAQTFTTSYSSLCMDNASRPTQTLTPITHAWSPCKMRGMCLLLLVLPVITLGRQQKLHLLISICLLNFAPLLHFDRLLAIIPSAELLLWLSMRMQSVPCNRIALVSGGLGNCLQQLLGNKQRICDCVLLQQQETFQSIACCKTASFVHIFHKNSLLLVPKQMWTSLSAVFGGLYMLHTGILWN